MVLEEARMMQAPISWHCVEGYVTWFYTVSHPIMTLDALGRPPRPAHEDILDNQHTQDDHAPNVFPIYQWIKLIGLEALDLGIIERGGPEAVAIIERMVRETSLTMGYSG